MESHKPFKDSSTSNFLSKKEEGPKKCKSKEDKRTLCKMYDSRAGRDLWRTSFVVPHSEVGLAKPDPFLTLVFSQPGAPQSAETDSKLKFASTRVPLMVLSRVHTAKSIFILPKLNNLEKICLFKSLVMGIPSLHPQAVSVVHPAHPQIFFLLSSLCVPCFHLIPSLFILQAMLSIGDMETVCSLPCCSSFT